MKGPTEIQGERSLNLGRKLMAGSLWMVLMRLSSRVVGLASMVIVARLLVPEDFGIFAVAMAAVAFVDALTDIGADLAIIKHPNPQREHYDTAWTFGVGLHTMAAAVVAVFSHFATQIYSDDRYQGVFLALAASIALSGLKNIGTADFRRNLQFNLDFKFTFVVQVVGVLTTLACAYLLRSYWALVIGVLVRSAATAVLSYTMHPYRPRLSLKARAELASFSFWTLLRSLAMFLMLAGDRLVLGMYYDPTTVGLYAIASSLALMAVAELLGPIGRALLPGISIKQGDLEWERRNLPLMFGGTATIAFFMATMASALSGPIIGIIYGDKFAGSAPMLAVLVWWAAIGGIMQPAGQYLIVAGKMREIAIFFMIEGAASVAAAYLLSRNGQGIESVLYGKLLISGLAGLRVALFLKDFPHLRVVEVLKTWIKPGVAALVTWLAIHHILALLVLPVPIELLIGLFVLVIAFPGTLFILWRATGRPAGVEQEIAQRLREKMKW